MIYHPTFSEPISPTETREAAVETDSHGFARKSMQLTFYEDNAFIGCLEYTTWP